MSIVAKEEKKMGVLGKYEDALVMVVLQCIYGGFTLFSRAAFNDGLSPMIFIVYRMALATLLIAPLAYFSMRRKGLSLWLDMKAFGLIFAAALFGITANQTAYFEGIKLSSATIASTLVNLNAAVTFVMAVIIRVEKVDVRSARGIAKIVGTVICVLGAIAVTLLKGPTLVSATVGSWVNSVLGLGESSSWLIGCVILVASTWFWSAWLVLQVHVNKHCPDQMYSTFLTCLFGLVQATILAIIFQRDIDDWKPTTALEYIACIYSGVGSTVTFFGQAWIVSRRGPVFFATFNPLCTVVVAVIGALFLDESIYLGTLLGAVTIIIGLYMVLWGKANDPIRGSTFNLEETLLLTDDITQDEEPRPYPLSPYPSFGSI